MLSNYIIKNVGAKSAVMKTSGNKKMQVIVTLTELACSMKAHYQKVPGLGQKRNAGLTDSILAAISFKIISLGTYTAIPSFFPHFKSTVEISFLNAVEYRGWVPLDVRPCCGTSSLQFHFQFCKQSEITGG
jgi:hypothetical protein